MRAAISHPDVKRSYASRGVDAFPPEQMTPEAGNAYIKQQIDFWAKTIRENGIKITQ